MNRKSTFLMTEPELLDYIDDTARLMVEAAAKGEPTLVSFYAGYVRTATRRLRERSWMNVGVG